MENRPPNILLWNNAKNLGCYNRQKTIVDTQLYNSCKMHVQNQQSYIQLEKGRNSIHSL